jgi:hypothetical protein
VIVRDDAPQTHQTPEPAAAVESEGQNPAA